MIKSLMLATITTGATLLALPANAQVSIGLGADVDLDVKLQVGDPYTYRGYHSHRWYYDDYERNNHYYEAYGGYDCHKGFKYTWYDDYRARYEAYWCFDDNDRHYEVRRTRAIVRID